MLYLYFNFLNTLNINFWITLFYFNTYYNFIEDQKELFYNIEHLTNIFLSMSSSINYNILFIISIILFFHINKFKSFLLFFFYYLFYFFEINNFNNFICLPQFILNQKLTNGLFLYHPTLVFVFYCVIYLFFKTIFSLKFLYLNIKNFKNIFEKQLKFLINYIIVFGLISQYLGSWWAFQELSWNNWWSWDLIELLNFFFWLFFLYKFHRHNKFSNYFFYTNLIFIFFFIFFFISIRYNLVASLHSFLALKNNYQYTLYILIVSIIFFILVFFSTLRYLKIILENSIKMFMSFTTLFLFFISFIFIFYFIQIFSLLLFNVNNIKNFYFFENLKNWTILYFISWVIINFIFINFIFFFIENLCLNISIYVYELLKSWWHVLMIFMIFLVIYFSNINITTLKELEFSNFNLKAYTEKMFIIKYYISMYNIISINHYYQHFLFSQSFIFEQNFFQIILSNFYINNQLLYSIMLIWDYTSIIFIFLYLYIFIFVYFFFFVLKKKKYILLI